MGNYFSSVNRAKQRCVHLEKEVDELKKTLEKETELKKSMEKRISTYKKFIWLFGFSCFALFAFFHFSSSSANRERIEILEAKIRQQARRIRILEKVHEQETDAGQKEMSQKKISQKDSNADQKVTVVNSQTSDDVMDILKAWLGGKRMKLLYNASIDGFWGESFHKKCDDKGATVTVITSSEGYMFGGYAAVPWGGDTRRFVRDCSGESFLFTLKNPQNSPPARFPLLEKEQAIWNDPRHGPKFGENAIVCGDNAAINNESYTDLGDGVYAKPAEYEGSEVLTGQSYFRAKEIQVYQVL